GEQSVGHEIPFAHVFAPVAGDAFAVLVDRDSFVTVPHRREVMPFACLPATETGLEFERWTVAADVVKVEQEIFESPVESHDHAPVSFATPPVHSGNLRPLRDREFVHSSEKRERPTIEIDDAARVDGGK